MQKILTILILHLILTTLLSITSAGLPTDMVENLLWGRELSLVYDKHPPLFAWQSYFAVKLLGGNTFLYQALTPINEVILLFCIFLLARKILNKEKAILCVIFLQGVWMYTFIYKFNANTANYALFGFSYLIFYKAVKEENYKLFLLLGFISGLIILTKYSGILLIALLSLTLIVTKEGRKALKSKYIFLGFIIFLLTIFPHFFAMYKYDDFSTIKYIKFQSTSPYMWYSALEFLLIQVAHMIPFLIAFFSVFKGFKRPLQLSFDGIFLLIVGILPFAITLIYSIIFKASLGTFWLSMFIAPVPLMFIYFSNLKEGYLRISIKVLYPILFLIYCIYILSNLLNPNENAKEVSSFIQEVQAKHYANGIAPKYFICNDARRKCGEVIMSSKEYSKSLINVSLFKDPFTYYTHKPESIFIIGPANESDLPSYDLYKYEKSFNKNLKLPLFEDIFDYFRKWKLFNLDKELEKKKKPITFTLTIAIIKKTDENEQGGSKG